MIFHLTNAGVPTSWSIVAYYPSYYGVALNAATSWHAQHGGCHLVVEIKNGSAVSLDMFWTDEHAQYSQDREIHIQGMLPRDSQPSIEDETRDLLSKILYGELVKQGFLIPNEEWEQRYPASKMVQDRFSEYFALRSDKNRDIEFEDKWAMMMEAPKDHELAYTVKPDGKGYAIVVNRKGMPDGPERNWREITDAEAVCRQMNSGWTYEEALVLLTPEPVEGSAGKGT